MASRSVRDPFPGVQRARRPAATDRAWVSVLVRANHATAGGERVIRFVLVTRRPITTRILRGAAPDDGRFDIGFWQRQGAEAIFAASWELVNEGRAMRGGSGDEPALQRSVVRLVRRRR